jgi:type I restriction enzyme S subunit
MRVTGLGRAIDAQSHKNAFQRNDVLYGKLRPYLDKAVLAEGDGICTTELLVLRTKTGVDPRYLACVVHASNFIEHAMTGITGAHHPRTSWGHIAQFEVIRHDRQEQAIIARLLWGIHDLLIACEAEIGSAQELKRAAMRELFTRGLRGEASKETEIGLVPESWEVVTINDVALKTQYGLSVRGQAQGGTPILRMNCQSDGRVVFRDLQYVDLDEPAFSAFRLESGDLLFNRTNSIEHVGRTAIYEGGQEAVFASYLVRLTVDTSRCLPHFLNYFMNRREVQADIKRLASRAVGQANINASKLRTVAFPLPPTLDEQREIVAILDAIDRKIALHRQKRAVLEELFKSLLHKLMTGEIRVDQLDLGALERKIPMETAS